MAYLSEDDLKLIGFKKIGKDVKISTKASIYNPNNISIGDLSRIDDFCIISAGYRGIHIGRNVHIACYTSLMGSESIIVEDFAGISSHTSIYSSTDDYSGRFLTGPTVPNEFRDVISKPIIIKKHVIIGAGSVILPGVVIGAGSAIGALSLVNKNVPPLSISFGIPAKKLKRRSNKLLKLEKEYLKHRDA